MNTDLLALSLFIFLLATVAGWEMITKIPSTLHTPLMSATNAISGITLVGALLAAGTASSGWRLWLGTAALILAAINVVGGYLVTDRMLKMFQKKTPKGRHG